MQLKDFYRRFKRDYIDSLSKELSEKYPILPYEDIKEVVEGLYFYHIDKEYYEGVMRTHEVALKIASKDSDLIDYDTYRNIMLNDLKRILKNKVEGPAKYKIAKIIIEDYFSKEELEILEELGLWDKKYEENLHHLGLALAIANGNLDQYLSEISDSLKREIEELNTLLAGIEKIKNRFISRLEKNM